MQEFLSCNNRTARSAVRGGASKKLARNRIQLFNCFAVIGFKPFLVITATNIGYPLRVV